MSNPSASEEPLALRLSDIQLDEIMRLAQPLALHFRDALLRILAYELRGRHDVGDGEFDPPDLDGGPHAARQQAVAASASESLPFLTLPEKAFCRQRRGM